MKKAAANLDEVYTAFPVAVLKSFDLNNLPIKYKEDFIQQIQNQLEATIRNVLLQCLSDDQVLSEIENVLIANPEIQEDELTRLIIKSNPKAQQIFEKSLQVLFQDLTKK